MQLFTARRARTIGPAGTALLGLIGLIGLTAVGSCSSAGPSKAPATASSAASTSKPAASSAASVAPSAPPQSPLPVVTPSPVAAVTGVDVKGALGSAPTITVAASTPPPKVTEVAVLSKGSGPALHAGDLAVVNDLGRTWASATTFQNTFDATTPPDALPIGNGQLAIAGLDRALVGVPAGSRALVVIPPSQGFGALTQFPTGVSKTDTAVLIFDVLAGYPANAGPTGKTVSSGGGPVPIVSASSLTVKPTITVPKSPPPSALSVTTLVQGSGRAVAKGDEVIAQYLGVVWASGKEFDSSWAHSSPAPFQVGAGKLIPAWDSGLIGVKAGSRVLMVVPPAQGYGSAGQSDAGITGTDTLVFVIDVLGTYGA